jgi:hypothetical protein
MKGDVTMTRMQTTIHDARLYDIPYVFIVAVFLSRHIGLLAEHCDNLIQYIHASLVVCVRGCSVPWRICYEISLEGCTEWMVTGEWCHRSAHFTACIYVPCSYAAI